jgi:hypothetical protein
VAISNIQKNNILGVVAGLFNAAPGREFLAEFVNAVDNGLTILQLADILAAHPAFTDGIMGGQNTTASQVAVLMSHFGLTHDGVTGSTASQAETFFTDSINSGIGFGQIIFQAGSFLLADIVPEAFLVTSNLFKNKITTAGIYSEINFPADLERLQEPFIGLSGATEMTQEEATVFLANGGFIANAFAAQIIEGFNSPLLAPVEFEGVSDSFSLNIISADNSEGQGGAFDIGENVTVTLADANGTTANGNAETFTLNAAINDANEDGTADGINARTITVGGVENLVIISTVPLADGTNPNTDFADHTLTARLIATDAEKLTITGDGGVDLVAGDISFSEATIGNVTEIDAGASTGNIRINLSGHSEQIDYTGSSGIDTFWGSAGGGTITAGNSSDFINLEGAKAVRDILVLNAASDSQISDTNNDGEIAILLDVGFDEIDNFKVGAASTDDRLDVSSFGFTGVERGIVDATSKIPTFDTVVEIVPDLFLDSGNIERGLAFSEIPLPPEHEFAGQIQTFVFFDVNKDGNFTAADDALIELMDIGPMSENIFIF